MTKKQENTLKKLLKEDQFDEIIPLVRELIDKDKRNLTTSVVKKWCGLRWRNIFINEGVHDKEALKKATDKGLFKKKDARSDRQKIAEKFLRGSGRTEWNLRMPEVNMPKSFENTSLLFAPGLINGLLPVRAFDKEYPKLEKRFKLRIHRADNHPVRSCDDNIEDMIHAIEQGVGLDAKGKTITEKKQKPLKDVFIVAYSKGMPDVLTLLVNEPEIRSRVRAVFSWAGAIGGSPLADDMYETVKDMNTPITEETVRMGLGVISPGLLGKRPITRLMEYDVKEALLHITTKYRQKFLKKYDHELDEMNIPFFNITGSTTMTDVPFFQVQGYLQLHKYDSNNDMQLTQDQAKLKIPMATDLAMLRGHHWDISYGPFPRLMQVGPNLNHPFPREAAQAAIVMLSAELGLIN